MDTALHPYCPSGALGREEFLTLLLIVLQNVTPMACPLTTVNCCPLQGMSWAQYQMAQLWGLPTLPPVVRGRPCTQLTVGERALLSLKTSEKAEGPWTTPSEKTDPLVAALLVLPNCGLQESCTNEELKWNIQNSEPGP